MKNIQKITVLAVLLGASGLASAQTTDPTTNDGLGQNNTFTDNDIDDNDSGNWGLAGLLGLIGLYGLRGNKHDHPQNRSTNTTHTH